MTVTLFLLTVYAVGALTGALTGAIVVEITWRMAMKQLLRDIKGGTEHG